MRTRITKADLDHLVSRLNAITIRPSNRQFELTHDCGGYCLNLVIDDAHSVRIIYFFGLVSTREAYLILNSFLQGVVWTAHNLPKVGQP